MLKAAIKHGASEDQVRHRIVPLDIVYKWSQTLDGLKDKVLAVLRDEKQEKQVGGFMHCTIRPPISYGLYSFNRQKWNLGREKI